MLNEYSVNEMARMKRLTRRDQQAEARRQQLLDVALALFAERGFEGTTIKDLCEAAGVAQGLVYHYFRSKEDLLFAVLEQQSFLPELRRVLVVQPDRPARAVLREIAAGFYALVSEREHLVRIVIREMQANPQVSAVLQRLIQEAVGMLASYLDARITAGDLRPHDSNITARTLFYTIFMLRLTHTPADEFLSPLVDTLLHGIAAEQAGGLSEI